MAEAGLPLVTVMPGAVYGPGDRGPTWMFWEAYVVAGEPYTLVEVFELVERITGIPAPRAIPPAVFRAPSRVVEPVEPFVGLPPRYTAEALRVLGGATCWGDNAKATRELGLEHRPFEEGLAETLEYEMARREG